MSHWDTNGKSDEWYTPKYIFDALEARFTTDVAAPIDRKYCHVPAFNFITSESLQKEWIGFIWCNPPFGGRNSLEAWVNKMAGHRNGILLTPDRTSAKWFQMAANTCDAMLFTFKKVKFINGDGKQGRQPSNGTTLFAYGEIACDKLLNARRNNLGYTLIKYHSCEHSLTYLER